MALKIILAHKRPAHFAYFPLCPPGSGSFDVIRTTSCRNQLYFFLATLALFLSAERSAFRLSASSLVCRKRRAQFVWRVSRFPTNAIMGSSSLPFPTCGTTLVISTVILKWVVLTCFHVAPKQKAQKMSIGTFLADESRCLGIPCAAAGANSD